MRTKPSGSKSVNASNLEGKVGGSEDGLIQRAKGLYNSLGKSMKNIGYATALTGAMALGTLGYADKAEATITSYGSCSPFLNPGSTGQPIQNDLGDNLVVNDLNTGKSGIADVMYQFCLVDYVPGGANFVGNFRNPYLTSPGYEGILLGKQIDGQYEDIWAFGDLDGDGEIFTFNDVTGELKTDAGDLGAFYTCANMKFDGQSWYDLATDTCDMSLWPSFNPVVTGRIPQIEINSPIPEPSTGALMLAGLAGLTSLSGNRKRADKTA